MALEDTATAETADQPAASTPAQGDTVGAAQPSEQTAAQGQTDDSAEPPLSDDVKAEIANYGDLVQKLPAPVRKEFNRALTQAFQRASEKGKRFEPYAQFISAYEADPVGTIRALAERANIIEAPPPAKDQVNEVLSELSQIVGEDEARRLAPAFEKLAAKVIEDKIQPLRQHQERVTTQIARDETTRVMEAFEAKHPGWQKHEPRMLEISSRLQPNGMDEMEYLETLHTLATAGIQSAEQTKALAEKMAKAAAASENVATGVNASRIVPAPRKFKSAEEAFDAAAEAARRGESWG